MIGIGDFYHGAAIPDTDRQKRYNPRNLFAVLIFPAADRRAPRERAALAVHPA
jgi:hypothetical protein